MLIINNILRIPAIIYIDDTIVFAKQENIAMYNAAIIVIYAALGYWLSHEKIE